jgi:hypothetical protein
MSRLSRGLTHRGSLRERTLRAGPIFSALCTLSESLSDSVVGAARGAVCRRATGCAGLESWGSGWWASADCSVQRCAGPALLARGRGPHVRWRCGVSRGPGLKYEPTRDVALFIHTRNIIVKQ